MQRTAPILIGVIAVAVIGIVAFLLLSGGSEPEPTPSPSPSASASAEPSASEGVSLNEDLLNRRWNVLYVGTDLNEHRAANDEPVNTDAVMLVSLSADQSRLTLVSLPRDTVDIPLPDGGTWDGKVNSIYREEGMDTLVGAMEATFGVEIDAHVLLDMDDFSRLVDAVDGIEVSPPEPIEDPIVNLDLEAGPQELTGPETLGYVRTRVDQDYGRMGRQQEVLVALVEKLVDPETELDLRQVLDSLDSLETDLPLDDLPTLLELASRARDADLETIVIRPPLITFEGDRNDGRGYVLEADFDAIRDEVGDRIGE
ncbi:MAG: LCP family protein [Chloroflexi bacterium]|nr:LCP family protein [Chloroflexota bacterium]